MVGLRVDGELYGMLGVYRTEVRPFDEREAKILRYLPPRQRERGREARSRRP
jgi:hypothetical protein